MTNLIFLDSFERLLLSNFHYLSLTKTVISQPHFGFTKICPSITNIFFLFQNKEDKSLHIFDLKNNFFLTKIGLNKNILHAQFGVYKTNETLYLSFEDNSIRAFNCIADLLKFKSGSIDLLTYLGQFSLNNLQQQTPKEPSSNNSKWIF